MTQALETQIAELRNRVMDNENPWHAAIIHLYLVYEQLMKHMRFNQIPFITDQDLKAGMGSITQDSFNYNYNCFAICPSNYNYT